MINMIISSLKKWFPFIYFSINEIINEKTYISVNNYNENNDWFVLYENGIWWIRFYKGRSYENDDFREFSEFLDDFITGLIFRKYY